MIKYVEPRVGNGGNLSLVVAVLALLTVVGSIIYEAVNPVQAVVASRSASYTGQFDVGTATCPGATTVIEGTSCTIKFATTSSDALSVRMTWDTHINLSLTLVAAAGPSTAAVSTASGATSPIGLTVAKLPAGTWDLDVADVGQTGPATYTVTITRG